MISVINGDSQELLYQIDDSEIDQTIGLLEKTFSEVDQDEDGDIICYE